MRFRDGVVSWGRRPRITRDSCRDTLLPKCDLELAFISIVVGTPSVSDEDKQRPLKDYAAEVTVEGDFPSCGSKAGARKPKQSPVERMCLEEA